MLRDLWGGSGDKYTDTDVRHIVILRLILIFWPLQIDLISRTPHRHTKTYKDSAMHK